MTADLAGFLLAQLDADATVAQRATPGPWHPYYGAHGDPRVCTDPEWGTG